MRTTTEERPLTTTSSATGPVARPDTREWLGGRISDELALFVGVAWCVLYLVGTALEPAADNPDVIPAWLSATLGVTLLGMLAVMAVGLVARRRWGLVVSMGAAVFFLALTVACPVSGHHTFGAWWFGQLACAIGLVAITGGALQRASSA